MTREDLIKLKEARIEEKTKAEFYHQQLVGQISLLDELIKKIESEKA
jgi:hypothetical protein